MMNLLRLPLSVVGRIVEALRPPRAPSSYPGCLTNEEIDAL